MFAVFGALALGLIVRYSMKNRDRVGVLMIPALATATGSLTWAILTWVGIASTDPLIWLATFVAAGVVAWVVNAQIIRRRMDSDNAAFGRIARH